MQRPSLPVLSISLALVACSASPTRTAFEDPTAGAGGPSGSQGTISGAGDAAVPSNQEGCSDAAKLVYVMSEDQTLYSFAPDKATFTKVGRIDCPGAGGSPNSMAIDRSGTAWVNFFDGSLFKVSTSDASCAATSYEKNQGGVTRFGMAFATDSASTRDETLFVVGLESTNAGKGLAKIDLKTMKLVKLGEFTGDLKGRSAELTGTGDGRLYGFFTTTPHATLARIDPATGATSEEQLLENVATGNAWAFSFWGGDFWFYTAGMSPSTVTRKQTSAGGALSVAIEDVGGFRIVGAGVSTCAPTAPPR